MPLDRDPEAMADTIVAQLETIRKSAGRIHRRPREILFAKDLTENFIDDDGVLRATILIDPNEPEFEDEAKFKFWNLVEWTVIHYLDRNEAENSRKGFRKEVTAFKDLFRRNVPIFGVPHRPESQRTATTAVKDLTTLGDRLVHAATFSFSIESSEVKT